MDLLNSPNIARRSVILTDSKVKHEYSRKMDLPFSDRDLILAASNFSSMITVVKSLIKKLENYMEHHVECLKGENNGNREVDKIFRGHMELWINGLKAKLKELEFYGRATTLRTFFYLNDYLGTLRLPVTKTSIRLKVPVHNITLETYENYEIPAVYDPKTIGKRKCVGKSLRKITTCQ